MGRRLGPPGTGRRVVALAEWWTQATQESRFALLRRMLDAREAKARQDPTLAELKLAIYLAEAEAGEIEKR